MIVPGFIRITASTYLMIYLDSKVLFRTSVPIISAVWTSHLVMDKVHIWDLFAFSADKNNAGKDLILPFLSVI